MLKFSIDQQLLERFPALRAGGFLVAGLDRASDEVSDAGLDRVWGEASAELTRRGVTLQNVAEVPILKAWRSAFAACGVKPSTFKSSPEALVRRLLKDGPVSTPLPCVNLYCAVSAAKLAPIGGYDLDALPSLTVDLRAARPFVDRFEPLGGRPEDMPLTERVPVYASGDTICCFSFNHRDSRSTCLRPGTNRAVFFSEAATEEQQAPMVDALERLRYEFQRRGAVVGDYRLASAADPGVFLTFGAGSGC
jgi:DNA/RNA-binding domain of Phe-tRNA-synthetase-like protein